MSVVDWEALRAAADSALDRAYAPYSGFSVAAALLDEQGHIHVGVNVENASYGLTTCAERNAIAVAVGAGARRFRALALVCSGETAVTPCGACRQVLVEFPPAFEVRCFGRDGSTRCLDSDALLPERFRGPT